MTNNPIPTGWPTREEVAREFYLAMYQRDGGIWDAVETKDVWRHKADRILALFSRRSDAGGDHSPDVGNMIATPDAGEKRDHIAEHLEATRLESIAALQRAAVATPAPSAVVEELADALKVDAAEVRFALQSCNAALTKAEAAGGGASCRARNSYPDPVDCDWPHCGCDPKATKVVEALIEEGWSSEGEVERLRKALGETDRIAWHILHIASRSPITEAATVKMGELASKIQAEARAAISGVQEGDSSARASALEGEG